MHAIKRRQILSACGGLGLFLTARANVARSETEAYDGPYLITLHAGGGWDPTMCFDGKTNNSQVEVPYSSPSVMGPYTYAPLTLKDGVAALDTVKSFLTDLGPRMLVLNGIDTQTNSHETGTRHVCSGKSFEALPSLGALFASSKLGGKRLSLPFLSTGGYDQTASLVPLSRIANPSAFLAVSVPSVVRPQDPIDSWTTYHSEATDGRIDQALLAREQRLAEEMSNPREKNAFDSFSSVAHVDGLAELALDLPSVPVSGLTAFPALNYNNNFLNSYLRSIELSLHAFASGQAVSANVLVRGFDTHTNHDLQHPIVLGQLFLTLRYLFRLADELNLSDRLYVVVGSDFGRTPAYNAALGKDHWNVTTMLVSGPGIAGGRVLGKTDERLRPMRVNSALDTYYETDAKEGMRITPGHVHRALRQKMGIADSEGSKAFPLPLATPLDDLLS